MQWRVTLNNKDKIVTLPESIPDNVVFDALIDGSPVKVRWQKLTKSLYILEAGSQKTWRCLNIRSASVNKFPGESDLIINSEFNPAKTASAIAFETSVALHIPGQEARTASAAKKPRVLRSQITGKVLKVLAKAGDNVATGDALLIIEAMKMENRVMANAAGVIDQIKVSEGETVAAGAELVRFKQN